MEVLQSRNPIPHEAGVSFAITPIASVLSWTIGNNQYPFLVGDAYLDTVKTKAGTALTSYWRLGETLLDDPAGDSIGFNEGKYSGVELGQDSLVSHPGLSAKFDGISGYVTVPHHSSLRLLTKGAIGAWVKPSKVTGSCTILYRDGNYYLRIIDGKYEVGFRNAANTSWYVVTSGAGTAVVNEEAFIVGGLTTDGTVSLYKNLAGVGSTAGGPSNYGTAPLYFGSKNGTSEFFEGQIDEVMLLNDNLLDANFVDIYNAGTTYRTDIKTVAINTNLTFTADLKLPPGVVPVEYYWRFGDGTDGYGSVVTHTYRAAVPSTRVSLCITDNYGRRTCAGRVLNLR